MPALPHRKLYMERKIEEITDRLHSGQISRAKAVQQAEAFFRSQFTELFLHGKQRGEVDAYKDEAKPQDVKLTDLNRLRIEQLVAQAVNWFQGYLDEVS